MGWPSRKQPEKKAEPVQAAPIDPVEAAKVSAPPPPEPTKPAPAEPPAVIALPPVAAPAPLHHQGRRAKVKTSKKVSLHGQFTTLPAGTIISEDSYGPGIFERLAESKVELEPLE
jgi:hypothetical protein